MRAGPGTASAGPRGTPEGKTYVLVHGAFHGAWCWRAVIAGLRAEGHEVHAPTLTGLGERAHLIGCDPSLETFVEDVLGLLRWEDLRDVVLVGHSFAGSVISAVADRAPDRLRHLVYLDAMLLEAGKAATDTIPAELLEKYTRLARETSGGLTIPPNEPEYYGITDPEAAAWLRARMTPHPFRTYADRLTLRNPLGNGVAATYVACANPYFPTTAPSRERARRMAGWAYCEIDTAHNAMMLDPAGLTRLLGRIG